MRLPFHKHAVAAKLGFIAAEPKSTDGHWILLIEGQASQPVAMAHVGLGWDFPSAPIAEAEDALRRSGYEYHNDVVTKPWAASWKLAHGSLAERQKA